MAIDQRAEILFTGGHVWTGIDRRAAPVDSVAVRAGRIVAAGRRDDIGWAVGPRTRVVSLRGRLLLPAFQDAHVHPLTSGMALGLCRLNDLPDEVPAYLDVIAAYARDHPERAWVLGSGWALSAFPGGIARASQLDDVVPDRPALLWSRDGHSAWANSVALAAAGLTATSADPPRGRIERHRDGAPQGTLQEDAIDLVASRAPAPTSREREEGLRQGQAWLHRLGVSAWQDASVDPAEQAAYVALAARGELTGRAALALRWEMSRGLEQVDELVARREHVADHAGGRVRAVAVKLFQDGVVESYTAAMLDPYLDARGRSTGRTGESLLAPATLRAICTALDRERFAVHAHAIGDRAVREVLDGLTAARLANGPRDGRHQIAHLQFVHAGDMPRFRALGVVAGCQPYWAQEDAYIRDLTRPFVGADRAARMYPFGSLSRHGATLALGSDWDVSTADPLRLIEVAIRRVDPARRESPPLGASSERLPPEAALRAATRGAAFVNWLDDDSGTIDLGRAADLVVLDRDPLVPGGPPFGDARVLLTLVDGRPVWEDPALTG